jgi:hypothetical protein
MLNLNRRTSMQFSSGAAFGAASNRGFGLPARSLAIVAYGDCDTMLRRHSGTKAEVISHYFRGTETASKASMQSGRLKVAALQHNLAGKPLEWIEVRITQPPTQRYCVENQNHARNTSSSAVHDIL